jgi:hypothetical protein
MGARTGVRRDAGRTALACRATSTQGAALGVGQCAPVLARRTQRLRGMLAAGPVRAPARGVAASIMRALQGRG